MLGRPMSLPRRSPFHPPAGPPLLPPRPPTPKPQPTHTSAEPPPWVQQPGVLAGRGVLQRGGDGRHCSPAGADQASAAAPARDLVRCVTRRVPACVAPGAWQTTHPRRCARARSTLEIVDVRRQMLSGYLPRDWGVDAVPFRQL